MKTLKSHSKKFPKILVTPEKFAYRGIRLKLQNILDIWDTIISKSVRKYDDNSPNNFKQTYFPMYEIESQTSDEWTSRTFAHGIFNPSPWKKMGEIIYEEDISIN